MQTRDSQISLVQGPDHTISHVDQSDSCLKNALESSQHSLKVLSLILHNVILQMTTAELINVYTRVHAHTCTHARTHSEQAQITDT